jgi:hypothetical protein
LPAPEACCLLKEKLNFCTCGTGSSELHLNFLTEWPDIQAGRSASSTMMFGNASCVKIGLKAKK